MSSRIVRAFAAAAVAVVVAGCDASHAPMAPSLVPGVAAAAAPADAPDVLRQSKPPSDVVTAIVVNRGELDFARNTGALSLYGSRGFSLTGQVSRSGGVIEAVEACVASNCEPGASIPLGATWSGTDLPATVTLDGTTYTNVGSLATTAAANVRFSGTLVAPPLTRRGSTTATAPFTLVSEFVHADGELLVTEPFTGKGSAKVWLVHGENGPGWSVERIEYRLK